MNNDILLDKMFMSKYLLLSLNNRYRACVSVRENTKANSFSFEKMEGHLLRNKVVQICMKRDFD